MSILKKRACARETEKASLLKDSTKRRVRFREPDDAFDQGMIVSIYSDRAFMNSDFCSALMWDSSFSCIQMSRPETPASSFSSCVWLLWWLAWLGLLFIVLLERQTQTCVPTSRKTWTFTLDLYDEEWMLSHGGFLLMHHSSYFMQWDYSSYYHFQWLTTVFLLR